jgi:hypothetical protein
MSANEENVTSGTTSVSTSKPRKKKRAKKRTPAKKGRPRNQPLPEPNEPIASVQPQPSLTEKVKGLFQKAQASADSPKGSELSSTSEPLSPESERILSAIPDHIGPGEPGEGGASTVDDAGDPIAALMAQVAFETQDVQDTLCELFDWLGERFESDHWKLTDRQARMMGRPTAQLLNSIWAKLQNLLPDILARWCEETPGATAFILACGIVVAPKIGKQIVISRERAASKKKGPKLVTNEPGDKE